jgi:ribosomal protein L37E
MNEQSAIDELYALIRFVYSKRHRLAEKIITAFEEALAAKTDPGERQAVIAHWLDFYQAHKYRKLMRRRRSTDRERMLPCSACGYPISQRHHLWDIATHGENRVTVQLCANCHELHHLMYNAVARDSAYSQKLIRHLLAAGQPPPEAVIRIYSWLRAILSYEIESGWLESYKLSDLWIEDRLGWRDYLNSLPSAVGT